MTALIQVKNLKTYIHRRKKAVPVVDGLYFQINKGERVAIVGESGCGKSMTSLSIMRLLPPQGQVVEGEILFQDRNLLQLKEKEMNTIRGNDISMIFQEPMTSLNPVLTVGEQLIEVLRHHKKLGRKEAQNEAKELLAGVGFSRTKAILKEYPHRLSGGMRQRVMIAMAISCQPQLIIADEPTTALDVTIQAQIIELLISISEAHQSSILLITHDLGIVAEAAHRVAVMYAGQIIEEGPVEELYQKPLHPYTEGLLSSVPTLETKQKRLYSIGGRVPLPGEIRTGCRFAPRCPQAQIRCFQECPKMISIKPYRSVRCFLRYGEGEVSDG